jgi:hypothetical protein
MFAGGMKRFFSRQPAFQNKNVWSKIDGRRKI